jgi:CRISPR system Cascade subunit CasD
VSTLLLRLEGPMQSWGTQSRFTIRDTGQEPSKSGVIGLLCAALGRPRAASLIDLVALRLGVRVDREGAMRVDYQTAGGEHRKGESYGVAKASGGTPDTVQSNRYYLADASFLVGLSTEGNDSLLREIAEALAAPVWQISLGRKSYVPGTPVWLPDAPPLGPALRDLPLLEALQEYPWPTRRDGIREEIPVKLRLVLDDEDNPQAEIRRDVPVSFEHRQFGLRRVSTDWLERPSEGGNDVSVSTDPQSA